MKVLVVDDEQDLCEILQYNLETEGYEVVTANSAEEALEQICNSQFMIDHVESFGIQNSLPDIILLDVMMGEMSGFQMARKLKDNPETAHIPIIFITALDGEDNTVKGLNIGADDYIAKPLSMKEVKARVKAVLRRVEAHPGPPKGRGILDTPSNLINYEGIRLDLDSKSATLDGEELSLTKLEFELLALFLQHPNKVYSRNDLLEMCWPDDVLVLDRTVDVNITRLRKKLGRYGKQIKTRVGYGYYWEE